MPTNKLDSSHIIKLRKRTSFGQENSTIRGCGDSDETKSAVPVDDERVFEEETVVFCLNRNLTTGVAVPAGFYVETGLLLDAEAEDELGAAVGSCNLDKKASVSSILEVKN